MILVPPADGFTAFVRFKVEHSNVTGGNQVPELIQAEAHALIFLDGDQKLIPTDDHFFRVECGGNQIFLSFGGFVVGADDGDVSTVFHDNFLHYVN